MVAGQTVRLLVITEDSAQEAFTALSWLVKKAARLLEPQTQTQHLQLSPLTGNQGARLAAMAMGWKSQQPADDNKRRDLVRTITTALLGETWVIFHYDADVDWKRYHQSLNRERFARQMRADIERALRAQKLSETQVQARLSRLVEWVPAYCIEAWYYRAWDCLRAFCVDAAHLERLAVWQAAPENLENEEQPWKHTAAGRRENLALAKEFPATEVYGLRLSFFEGIEKLRGADGLLAALAATVPSFGSE